jgi:hypothetical protein
VSQSIECIDGLCRRFLLQFKASLTEMRFISNESLSRSLSFEAIHFKAVVFNQKLPMKSV